MANLFISEAIAHNKKLRHATEVRRELDFLALDIEVKQSQLESDLEAVGKLKEEIAKERNELKDSLNALEDATLLEISGREREANERILKSRVRLAQKMRSLKARYWALRRQAQSDAEFHLSAVLRDGEEIFYSLTKHVEAELTTKSLEFVNSESAAAIASTALLKDLITQGQEGLKRMSASLEADYQADFDQGQKILSNTVGQLKKLADQGGQAIAENLISSFVSDLTQLDYQFRSAKEELDKVKGELRAIGEPGYCPINTRPGEKANEFIKFISTAFGLKLNWIGSVFLKGDCLQLDFDFHPSEDKGKAIAKIKAEKNLEAIRVRFGTEGIIIEPNYIDNCWRATIPAHEGYRGGNDEVYQVEISHVAESLSQELQRQLTYDATASFMSDFVPVTPIPQPTALEPTNQELTTLSWFTFWREEVTGQPNIVTPEGLLKTVYGIENHHKSAVDPDLGESPKARLERIMAIARTNYGELLLNG